MKINNRGPSSGRDFCIVHTWGPNPRVPTSVGGLQIEVAAALMHVLENDGVAVAYPVVAQRLLVVHERQAVERDDDLVGRHAALDLTKRLEVLQLQLLAHVEDEDAVVAERRHRHLHHARASIRGPPWKKG